MPFLPFPTLTKFIIFNISTVQVTPTLTLHSVLHVPTFSYNLLSVSSLTSSSSCSVTFSHNHCLIHDAFKGKQIGIGWRICNLYVLELSPPTPNPSSASASAVIGSNVWHSRLGHLGPDKLKLLSSSLKVVTNTPCDVCPLSKQKRLSYPLSSHIADSVFDLIYCDIWEPFHPVTIHGHKYFLTIVDDCSRCVWTYLLESKTEVSTVLPQFFQQVFTQFDKSVKIIRCDNGSEFHLPHLFYKFGTLVQHSCVESPQQNARVERKHQHPLNVARSLYFQFHIPLCYLGDCVLTAPYLINHIPSSVRQLSNSSPF